MKSALVFVAMCATVALGQDITDDKWVTEKFHEYINRFGKTYTKDELPYRYAAFKRNLADVEYKNTASIKHGGATFELNEFSDLSAAEFKKQYLPDMASAGLAMMKTAPRLQYAEVTAADVAAMPTEWDWTSQGNVVSEVKNQGQCGSCWSFSATGNMEGQWALSTGNLTSLSESNLVDCDYNPPNGNQACNGGLPSLAYQYVIKNGGIDTEASYPYVPEKQTCKFNSANIGAKFANWTALPQDEDLLAAWLWKNGPISIGINAGWMQTYSHGIHKPLFKFSCPASGIDHGVLLVGYGTAKTIFGHEEKFWKIKNSWGGSWGESGFCRIIRGESACGLNQMATSACVGDNCAPANPSA